MFARMPPSARIDQAGGAGSGVAGNAREGLWLSTAISLVDVGVGSPASRLWTLVDRPPGSAAALVNPTLATATLTPDLPGSYLFQLRWNDDAKQIFERVLRVTLDAAGVWPRVLPPLPAAGEERHHSNGIAGQGEAGRGWAPLHDALRKRAGLQTAAYAASLTIDFVAGTIVRVGALTGNITIENPINPVDGELFSIETVQDGTGARVITWGNRFEFHDGMQYNDRRAGIRTIYTFRYNFAANKYVALERVLDPVGGGFIEFSSGTPTLVPGLINVLRATVSGATVPAKTTGWGGARNCITVKLDNLTTPPINLTRSGADTLNGGTTYALSSSYTQAVLCFDAASTSGTILVSPG